VQDSVLLYGGQVIAYSSKTLSLIAELHRFRLMTLWLKKPIISNMLIINKNIMIQIYGKSKYIIGVSTVLNFTTFNFGQLK